MSLSKNTKSPNFQFQILNFPISNLQFLNPKNSKFHSLKIQISQFLNSKSQIYKIQVLNLKIQFPKSQFKISNFKFISKILNFQNFKLSIQNFHFKSVFKIFKHMINSIVPIKLNLMELICATYKWVRVGPDISCIIFNK